jgi:hypothetical protein
MVFGTSITRDPMPTHDRIATAPMTGFSVELGSGNVREPPPNSSAAPLPCSFAGAHYALHDRTCPMTNVIARSSDRGIDSRQT